MAKESQSLPEPLKKPIDSFARIAMQILAPYQKRFDKACVAVLPTLGEESPVRKAIAYSVQSGGKRLRPSIVWMVAEALHSGRSVDLAAIAVEFFHVSSLIIDDLPCMDNDDFRRGIPTTHKAFSEAEAIMASFAMTAAGFELISRIPLSPEREGEVLRAVYAKTSCAIGLHGLIGGQQCDLQPKGFDVSSINTIMDLKTGALFELCFALGWLFGGGVLDRLEDLHTIALHFGRAFQIMDDLDDLEQDKAAGKRVNFALLFGVEEARREGRSHIDQFCALASTLGLEESPLVTLASAMRLVIE